MNKHVMKKWVKALRSGKYKQTRGRLKGQKGMCCLGVLCDISGVGSWERDGTYSDNDRYGDEDGNFSSEETLTPGVMEWAGMKCNVGLLPSAKSLANYNDKCHYGFKKIADIIENNYKDL